LPAAPLQRPRTMNLLVSEEHQGKSFLGRLRTT